MAEKPLVALALHASAIILFGFDICVCASLCIISWSHENEPASPWCAAESLMKNSPIKLNIPMPEGQSLGLMEVDYPY